ETIDRSRTHRFRIDSEFPQVDCTLVARFKVDSISLRRPGEGHLSVMLHTGSGLGSFGKLLLNGWRYLQLDRSAVTFDRHRPNARSGVAAPSPQRVFFPVGVPGGCSRLQLVLANEIGQPFAREPAVEARHIKSIATTNAYEMGLKEEV